MTEIMLNRIDTEGQPEVDPARVADYIAKEYLPDSDSGQRLFIDTEEGEAEFVIASSRTWAETNAPTTTTGEREMTAGTSSQH